MHLFSEMVSRHPKLIPVNILMQGQQDLEQSKCEFSDFFTFQFWILGESYISNLAVYFIVLIYLHSFSEMVSLHPRLILVNILAAIWVTYNPTRINQQKLLCQIQIRPQGMTSMQGAHNMKPGDPRIHTFYVIQ